MTARLCLATSLASLAVILLMVLMAGAATPNYSHLSQFISELGARGAPYENSVRYAGFLPAGLSLIAFCYWAAKALPASRSATLGFWGLGLYAAGYLVAAYFPCDLGCRPAEPSLSQVIHNAAGVVGYLLAPAFLICFALAARNWPGAGYLVVAAYIASGLALLGMLTLSPISPFVGLSQRLVEAAVLGWSALCGIYIDRHHAKGLTSAPSTPRPP